MALLTERSHFYNRARVRGVQVTGLLIVSSLPWVLGCTSSKSGSDALPAHASLAVHNGLLGLLYMMHAVYVMQRSV